LDQVESELLQDKQDRDLLHLMIGYALLPDCRQQCCGALSCSVEVQTKR